MYIVFGAATVVRTRPISSELPPVSMPATHEPFVVAATPKLANSEFEYASDVARSQCQGPGSEISPTPFAALSSSKLELKT